MSQMSEGGRGVNLDWEIVRKFSRFSILTPPLIIAVLWWLEKVWHLTPRQETIICVNQCNTEERK